MKLKWNWVPNALSLGNLTFGFLSILVASQAGYPGKDAAALFFLSGVFIILAALFDGFDGMVARALNATSELGAELDTLADLTTFGIAPGFLVYKMILEKFQMDFLNMGLFLPVGMLVAALFPICAAYRLARFTVAHDPSAFTGLPSPIAGVMIAFFPISFSGKTIADVFTVTSFILIALLMVSTIRYSKPQVAMRGKFSKGKLYLLILGLIAIIAVSSIYIPIAYILYGIVFSYVFSGIISFMIHIIQEF
jgi:CDP-diacylglycerol---serine O-phosphatidyltransferase